MRDCWFPWRGGRRGRWEGRTGLKPLCFVLKQQICWHPLGSARAGGSTFGEPHPSVLLDATGPPGPLPWDQRWAMGTREGGTPSFCIVGLQTPHCERGGAVGVGGTVWAAEVARAQGMPSFPAAAKRGFWAWPGSAVCTKEAHRAVSEFVTFLFPLFTSVPCLQ